MQLKRPHTAWLWIAPINAAIVTMALLVSPSALLAASTVFCWAVAGVLVYAKVRTI